MYINYSFHSSILFFSITALVQCDFSISFLNTFSITNSTQSTKLIIQIRDIIIYTVVFSGRRKSYLDEFMSLAKLKAYLADMTEICTIKQLMCVLVFVFFFCFLFFCLFFYRIPAAIIWVLSECLSPQPVSHLAPLPLKAMSKITNM